jgi:hypothetical protein
VFPGWTHLKVARPGRFELPTLCLEGRRSIQLSYGRRHCFHSRTISAETRGICLLTFVFLSEANGGRSQPSERIRCDRLFQYAVPRNYCQVRFKRVAFKNANSQPEERHNMHLLYVLSAGVFWRGEAELLKISSSFKVF